MKSITSLLDDVRYGIAFGLLTVACLFSGLAWIVSLPAPLSDVEPLINLLGFSQLISSVLVFVLLLERLARQAASKETLSEASVKPEPSPEAMLEEAEDEEGEPDDEDAKEEQKSKEAGAAELIRRIRRRPPKVDESE